ncbi:MAG: class I SAM-dependent methyltransferase [Campylobacterota bacterium]|nr:class I SAM-dependent methyltransferase [Campylobacterota bacterium]
MKKFINETMWDILIWLEAEVEDIDPSDKILFQIPNPDLDTTKRYHSWRSWSDLATLLYCRMMTPHIINDREVIVSFQKLDHSDSFHTAETSDHREKYGTLSSFSLIEKNEEPAFIFAFVKALKQVKIEERQTILDLGVNSGDEFEVITSILPKKSYKSMSLIGIDHSRSAIERAKMRFPQANISLYCHDINHLKTLSLPKADLIISIGTLQSPSIEFKPLFMSLIQDHLTPSGAIILGFPNCRWIDGEMIYGAKAPNYNFSEMSLVIKDIYFCKKYLQQHRFRVTITGKEYLFLTATKIRIRLPQGNNYCHTTPSFSKLYCII